MSGTLAAGRSTMAAAHKLRDEVFERSPAPEELAVLHGEMSIQILRLEGHLEELPPGRLQSLLSSYLRRAIFLRDSLARLTEATLRTYRWAVVQLAEVRHLFGTCEAAGMRPIPLGALAAFDELSELCASSYDVEARLLVALLALDDAIYRLIEKRDGLEEILVTRSVRHGACPD